MLSKPPPTDQRSAVRPISFVLDENGYFSEPITLGIRPEELSYTYPPRNTVHQTLGREVGGWVDKFGPGLPTASISGHTGWRALADAQDGVQAFMNLKAMVDTGYHEAVQSAIDAGNDPGGVKLLYIDMLNEIAWHVEPGPFTLRRSKSRPLLMQYQMSLQAVSLSIDTPGVLLPFQGNVTGGLRALGGVIGKLKGFAAGIKGLIDRAVSFGLGVMSPIGSAVKGVLGLANDVFQTVHGLVSSTKNGFNALVNGAIEIASDIAAVGVNVMRTISSIANLPSELKASLSQVAAAFNEAKCIFANALRPQATYEQYDGIYGSSNCSSTTGGRAASAFTNSGPFQAIQPDRGVFGTDAQALSSIAAITRSDPVLAPMPLQEVSRHLGNINTGLVLQ